MSFKKIHKHPDPLLAGMLYRSRLIPLVMTVRWVVSGDSGSDLSITVQILWACV